MKNVLMAIFLLTAALSVAQSVNDYKYAMIPSKFNFQKEADQYKLNTYTKMYMEKYGFQAWIDTDAIPAEVANSNCNKVYVELDEQSNMFITKIKVILKDCTNKILYTSGVGESRDKDYKTAYTQALRGAFASFDGLKYKYNGKDTKEVITEKTTELPQKSNPANGIVLYPDATLSAVKTKYGYDVVAHKADGSVGSSAFKLMKTSVKNIFIVEMSDRSGVLLLKEEKWFFEHYINGQLISQNLIIDNLSKE